METQAIQIALDSLTARYKEDYKQTPKSLKKNHIYAIAKRAKKQLKAIREPKYLLFHVDTIIGEYRYRCLYPKCEKDLLQDLNERLGSNYKTVWEFQQSPEYAQEYVIVEIML